MKLSDERERFERLFRVEPNGCWVWTGAAHRNGYGKFGRRQADAWRTETAHRVAWSIYRGPIPAGLLVCHNCDTRPCVNPDHLWLGTQRDNLADMRSKDRYMTAVRISAYAMVGPKIAAGHRRRQEFSQWHGRGQE